MNKKIIKLINKKAACYQYIYLISAGEKVNKVNIENKFKKENQEAEIYILAILKNESKLLLTTKSVHLAKKTKSLTDIRAVLFDKANFDHKGMIKISKKGSLTNSFLKSQILVIGEDCEAISIPSLEILNNDVAAGHASTIGSIDNDQLFYLQSRGFSLKEATDLLTQSYFETIIEAVASLKNRDIIRKWVKNNLKTLC